MHEIIPAMEINAPPRSVWKALVDFQAHPQWNPFVRSIQGSPREGETLKVFINRLAKPERLSCAMNQNMFTTLGESRAQ